MALHVVKGSGTPIGNITPVKLSQHYTDIINGHTWLSYGLTDQDWVEVGSGTFAGDPEPKQAQDDRLEPSGFIRANLNTTGVMELSSDGTNISRIDSDRLFSTNATSTFYDGTAAEVRTFRIMPKNGEELIVWIGGQRKSLLGQSIQLPNTNNTHIIYLDSLGVLKTTTPIIASNFKSTPIVAIAYWNVTKQEYYLFADERHGIEMSGAVHEWIHNSQGAQYISGSEPLGLVDGSTTFNGVDSGEFVDEDIKHHLAMQSTLPFWYIDGNEWVRADADNKLGFIASGDNYVSYNKLNGSSYILEEIASDEAMYVFLVETNDARYPYLKMLGQTKFDSAANAEGDLLATFNDLDFGNAPSPEFKILGAYIINGAGELVVNACGCPWYDFRRNGVISKFGDSFAFAQDEYTASNGSSTSWVTYLSLNAQNQKQARYRIGVSVVWRHSNAGRNIQIRAVANGTTLGVLEMEPKDTGSDIREPNYGVFYYDLPSDGYMYIDIDFKPENSGDTSYVYAATIEKWRVV